MNDSPTIIERLIAAVEQSTKTRSDAEADRLDGILSRLAKLRERGLLVRPKYSAPTPDALERQYSPYFSRLQSTQKGSD